MAKVGRSLPVLNRSGDDRPEVPRSARQWVFIGAGMILTLWMPLLVLLLWVAQRSVGWARSAVGQDSPLVVVAAAGPLALSFALACLGGGALVGRFGPTTGSKPALLAGGTAAGFAWVLAALSGELTPVSVAAASAVALVGFGTLFAKIGHFCSRRHRRQST